MTNDKTDLPHKLSFFDRAYFIFISNYGKKEEEKNTCGELKDFISGK